MAHTELDLRERRTIEYMLNAKCSVDEIAAEIGRHRSTIHREIKRNFWADDAFPKKYAGYFAHATPPQSESFLKIASGMFRMIAMMSHQMGRV